MRPTWLQRFRAGTRTASPVARHVLVTVLPLSPRRSVRSHRSECDLPCCLRPQKEGSASGTSTLTRPPLGSLLLRPGDSLPIPRMDLSIGFIRFISSADAIQATEPLTLAPEGLKFSLSTCQPFSGRTFRRVLDSRAGCRRSSPAKDRRRVSRRSAAPLFHRGAHAWRTSPAPRLRRPVRRNVAILIVAHAHSPHLAARFASSRARRASSRATASRSATPGPCTVK
jgi:hypothetical protein